MVQRRRRSSAPGADRYRKWEDEEEEQYEREDDEEHYERPRRSRRSRDEEERPRRGRSRSRDEDDEEEEEEEERPRRGRSRSRDDDDEEEEPRSRSRRSRDDDDDDDIVGSGWDSVKEGSGGGGGNFPDRPKLKDHEDWALVKFLEDEPFSVYERHWTGGRGYTCLGRDCPLCDAGVDKTQRAAFNVAVLVEGNGRNSDPLDPPALMVYDAAPTVANFLKGKHEDDRSGPLPKHYWLIETEQAKGRGGKGFTKHNFSLVKERDVEEDYDIPPLEDDEIEELLEECWGPEEYPYTDSEEDLDKVAREISRNAYDDGDRGSRRGRGRRRR